MVNDRNGIDWLFFHCLSGFGESLALGFRTNSWRIAEITLKLLLNQKQCPAAGTTLRLFS